MLDRIVGKQPAEIVAEIKGLFDRVLKIIQEKYKGTVSQADFVVKDDDLDITIQCKVKLPEVQEVQRFMELPETKFSNFEEADKWAEEREGYALEKKAMTTGKGTFWRVMVKISKLSEEEVKEFFRVEKNEIKQ